MAYLLELENMKIHRQLKERLKIIWPLVALALVGVVLYMERTGITQVTTQPDTLQIAQEKKRTPAVTPVSDTLVLWNSQDEVSSMLCEEMKQILDDMRVAYDVLDMEQYSVALLKPYDKAVLCFSDLDLFGEEIGALTAWVKTGGCLMNMVTYDITPNFQVTAGKLGILEGGSSYASASGFYVEEDFMIGAKDREFHFEETYESSLNVLLKDSCRAYVYALENDLPLLWECDYGEGTFVVLNQALSGKVTRGLLAAGYSLMDDISIYPVINASAFYLDDFPAPVPGGNGEYIQQEYGMDISNFYSNIWWKDVLDWEEKYGIVHSGLIIEDYSDLVEKPFPRMLAAERFRFFGNMLLNHEGELGFHGYNHMPLCLEGFDYKGLYDSYELWESPEAMQAALLELESFSRELFPNCTFSVYVPPSNIISEEGRAILTDTLPDIRAIASTYLPGDCVYEQEFGVREDGIVETPRVTSGAIMDEHTYLMTFSELNMHYVQSHFMHPDDVLDEDRGAALGWGVMRENLEEYMDYIYTSAPNIRDVTGSGMADAVEDFDAVSLVRTKTEQGLRVEIGGFSGLASFLLRVKEGSLEEVQGAEYEQLTSQLYVIMAEEAVMDIVVKQ